MSRDFNKVAPTIWQSKRFSALDDRSARAFFYLMTNHHQNCVGCFYLPRGYACADLNWTTDKYLQAEAALMDSKLIKLDEITREVLILRWLDHNPPMNPKHALGATRLMKKIKSDELREFTKSELQRVGGYVEEADTSAESRAKGLGQLRAPYHREFK
jgi:hypothetical protein